MSQFYAGYGRVDITPKEPVPLMGYGNTIRRISETVLDPLCATCVALSDGQDGTILMLGVDSTVPNYTGYIREEISAATGLSMDQIQINVTHTHSAPDFDAKHPGVAPAAEIYKTGCVEAAIAAYRDLKPATAFYGSIETEGLNFVRHYLMDDGSYGGDNFGDWKNHRAVKNATEVDPTMHLLKFVRQNGPDILVLSWRAHASITGGSRKPDVSADFVGSVRSYLEEKTGALFAYWQGCAGNVNPRSRIPEEDCTRDNWEFGRQLGDFALRGLESMTRLPYGPIRLLRLPFDLMINHTTDHLLEKAKEIKKYYTDTADWSGAKEMGKPYGIRTPFMAGAIVKRAGRPATKETTLTAFTLGDDLVVIAAAHEMFDSTGQAVEDASPFRHTISLGYTNGQWGYMPTLEAWRYTCYETDTSGYEPGSAERIQEAQMEMLQKLHNKP